MVKLSKGEFDIFALRKHKVNGGTTKAQRTRTRQRHSNKNIKPDLRMSDDIFLKPKVYLNVWRAGG